MGGTRRFRRGNRSQAEKRRKENATKDGRPERSAYKEIERTNPDFIQYYQKQKIVPEEEWPQFMDALGRDLPAAIRISSFSVAEASALKTIIEGKFFSKLIEENSSDDNETAQKPICLQWYPGKLCWQLQLTRKDIRRSENYFRLHNFLMSETGSGNISRQEVVSMIPPVLLDVQSHHKVLDMCAAPGSKTSQLIEFMHSNENEVPEGVVIANDIDNSRCYMLVHQAKRLNSPCVVITNHDASAMPNFKIKTEDGSQENLKFDRILCDVPCTGDGTLRKNADIWLKWNTANGNNLHGVQVRVIRRGVQMLAVGGRLVYSTCSFNPIENEAVIHRILVESQGALQLVDVSTQLPGLKWTPGISHWHPSSRDMTIYNNYEEVPEKWQSQVSTHLFPPSETDVPKFNLNRCIRVLPHHQDTGGFFVAVLEKIKLLPWEAVPKSKTNNNGVDDNPVQSNASRNEELLSKNGTGENRHPAKRRKILGYKEDPFVFFEEDEPIWPSIRDFFEVDPTIHSGLLTRCAAGKKKNVYFVSPTVRKIIENKDSNVKLINTGVRAFVRCDNDKKSEEGHCSFRLAQEDTTDCSSLSSHRVYLRIVRRLRPLDSIQKCSTLKIIEGLSTISSYIGAKRRVRLTKEDMLVLLNNNDPKFPLETTLLDSNTQERVKDLSHGSCVLEYKGECGLQFELVGWRGIRSLRAYISIIDSVHYLRLLGGDVTKFEKNKFKKEDESCEKNDVEVDPEKEEEEELDNNIETEADP